LKAEVLTTTERGVVDLPMPKSPAQHLEEYRAIAAEHGGELLSDRWLGSATLIRWRCAAGHEWETKAGTVRRGTWCAKCAGRRQRYTLEDMRAVAEERGGRCLSRAYRGSGVKLLFECAEGHRWRARPAEVRHATWCPQCAGTAPRTLAEMQAVAKERGGRCLSRE
jgi:hypothetical protein